MKEIQFEDTKMTIYIAGPMRGKKFYNFDEFLDAEDRLRAEWNVANPARAEMDRGFDPYSMPADTNWHSCPADIDQIIARDIQMILDSDAIYLLDGWEKSKGARAESALAEWLGLEIYFQSLPQKFHEEILIDLDTLHATQRNPEIAARASVQEDILEEALRITSGDRQASYGPPDQDFARTANLWNSLFAHKLSGSFTPSDVAMAMICLKLSRETHQCKRDNRVDIAGYARCLDICQQTTGQHGLSGNRR